MNTFYITHVTTNTTGVRPRCHTLMDDQRVEMDTQLYIPYSQEESNIKVPIVVLEEDNEVLAKLVNECDEKNRGAALEPPPVYSETDPLQSEAGAIVLEVPALCRDETSSVSTGSWDEDDDDEIMSDAETAPNWSELTGSARLCRVAVYSGKFLGLLALLYIFICSLDFLSSAFRILGGKTAGEVFTNSELLRMPVTGLMIGIMATVLVQSSSTSTSIIVTMVGSGIIDVRPAIPMIMGANVGTSVTNTFVSMAQSGDKREFRRAFAGATVHDMFNWLTVLILLPIEWATGYLYHLSRVTVGSFKLESYKGGKQEMLKALTKPFTSLVVQVDKKVINKIAEGHEEYKSKSLIKKYCVYDEVVRNVTVEVNGTMVTQEVTDKIPIAKCTSLLSHLDINETLAGALLLIFSLVLLCVCLVAMVKLLHSLLQGSIAKIIRKTLNADFPGYCSVFTGYVAILVGAVMTVLVQSSSVFTSALTPLVGIGMIKLERMYPLTLGSNIGTTGTGLLAAMAASGDKLPVAIQIALCHLFFNISGILMFYPIPKLRAIPIKGAKFLGSVTAEYRWFAMAYIVVMFLLVPGGVFALSMAGMVPCIVVASIAAILIIFFIFLHIAQKKFPKSLPEKLRTFKLSLRPVDNVIMKVVSVFSKCCPVCCVNCCKPKQKKPNNRQVAIRTALAVGFPKPQEISPASSAASSVMLLNVTRV